MDFWISASTAGVEQLADLARKAEQVGFAGVSLGEHLFTPARSDSSYPGAADGRMPWPPNMPFPDLWVAIGAMAAATTRLRFTNNVYILPLRNPFVAAQG